ncbi:MAG: MMPL family transporter [Cytophagales bacterium]|nr:MMPL family transporter [Cytophagales bacterium]MDW8384079.1 MMPL family transporter [Flammeovirgaceae bacterium]
MWLKIAYFILKNRITLLSILVVITAFMGYHGRNLQLSYEFMRIVPETDGDMLFFQQFKKTFGDDGNLLVIGVHDSAIYHLSKFKAFAQLTYDIGKLEGITEAISIPQAVKLVANADEKKFEAQKIFSPFPKNQQELDSMLEVFQTQKFYENRLYNPHTGATVILCSYQTEYLNSEKRIELTNNILKLCTDFEKKTRLDLHYAGLPYVRTINAIIVKKELNLFIIISLLVTAVVLFLFFRSFSPVIFPLILIGMVVVWTMGTIGLMGYKITMLTGLLPSILVVIGIPNSIYLVTKYHQECSKHGNKMKAMVHVIKKIGIVTLITNATTAAGFFVLCFTGVEVLKEFGIVAGINILNTFLISLVFIPSTFTLMPSPQIRHTKHLDFKPINSLIDFFEECVFFHRKKVYWIVGFLLVFAIIGMMQIKVVTYMVDDLPENSSIKQDLAFFEHHFKGIMPLEIVLDTQRKKGFRKYENLEKIHEIETALSQLPYVTEPISVLTFLKAANQAYFDSPEKFDLPTKKELPFIASYLKLQQDSAHLTRAFLDSTGQFVRLSMKIADIGSVKMEEFLYRTLQPLLDSLTKNSDIKARITGTTLLFIKGNDFLIQNLMQSILLAFLMIALIMGLLFGNVRIILIALIPNIIPILVTAGMMGWLGIPLKPSTAIVFSIAFGISVDDTIHYLAKYRQELLERHYNVLRAISISLHETGKSMFYTSVVLFFGFIIFAFSSFGGTIALGILTSSTLLYAMLTNLILLPSLLRTFEINQHRFKLATYLEEFDNFYLEDDDEEIDINLLQIRKNEQKKTSD